MSALILLDSNSQTQLGGGDPKRIYTDCQAARQSVVDELTKLSDRIGLARVAVFGIGCFLAWLTLISRLLNPAWLGIPGAVFGLLLYWNDQVNGRRRRAERAVRFYSRGLERLANRWSGTGEPGQRFLDESHPYALDLDLFGTGSLFERLSTARTHLGENTLADWLKTPARRDEIQARQEAVRDLEPRLSLREDLAVRGGEIPVGVDFTPLVSWGTTLTPVGLGLLRAFVAVLAAGNFINLLGWFFFDFTSIPLGLTLLLSGCLVLRLRPRVRQTLQQVDAVADGVALLAGLLPRLEREPFTAPRLRALQADLQADGHYPSEQVGELARLVDWHHAAHNQLFAPLAALLLWHTQMALAFEKWRSRSGLALGRWLTAIGAMEALSALAGYAFENPADPFPEIVEGPATFDGRGLGHPLVPAERCVRNDVHLVEPVRLLIVSGSNMSGKSTLLRTVGMNAVLGLAGAPVRAEHLTLTPAALGATLRIQDSLQAGRSRFFAEITRIRQLVDLTHGPMPLLFLLDELFHGTNSHDREIGARAVLRKLLDAGAMGLITTHDLALTDIARDLGPRAQNVHFADHFRNGNLAFDYRLCSGVVPHSNALALMRAVGLEVDEPAHGQQEEGPR
jgi:hypothetical protein